MSSAFVIYGGWDGHKPEFGARLFGKLLEEEGLRVDYANELAALDDAKALKSRNLIFLHWTMGELSAERTQNLTSAVKAGTGLAGFHGGLGDAFRANLSFQFMTGGQFVAHPGNIQPYRVQIRDEEHPITEGVDDFDLVSEQYYMLVDPAIRVLADTRFHGIGADWVQDTLLPVAWIKPYGAGRVFYSAVGHQEADLEEPNSQRLILRGMLWAAGLL